MSLFQTGVGPSRRAGNRFISAVRRALQTAFAEEAKKNGLSQAELARRRGVNRSVVTRELRGVENMTLRSVAEAAWAMGRVAKLEIVAPAQPHGQNFIVAAPGSSVSSAVRTSGNQGSAAIKAIGLAGAKVSATVSSSEEL